MAFLSFTCNFPGISLSPPAPTPTVEPIDLSWLTTPEAVDPGESNNNGGIGSGGEPEPTPGMFTPPITEGPPILYNAQAGDTLTALAARFSVAADEITSPQAIPAEAFITPGQLLVIPNRVSESSPGAHLLPDAEVVYSAAALDFDVRAFVQQAGGYLAGYSEFLVSTGTTSGAAVIERVAIENSINPRLLLALLEYQAGWVYGQPGNLQQTDYPMGLIDRDRRGLYRQLVWAVNNLSHGYYGYRAGTVIDLRFPDGAMMKIHPQLNAGTAALQVYFSKLWTGEPWLAAVSAEGSFLRTYEVMFGSPALRPASTQPIFPAGLAQPDFILPFTRNQLWAYSGGPHGAWERDGAQAAIDFAPGGIEPGCSKSYSWITAVAAGLVVRSERGVVVIDLEADGFEQSGWAVMYLHVANSGRVPVGTLVQQGDFLGYPSCEGGVSTGTHVHIARKYNGEWLAADGPIPFVLGGWQVHAGSAAYKGTLVRGDQTVTASDLGAFGSRIIRTDSDP